jgi:hypothetical protein
MSKRAYQVGFGDKNFELDMTKSHSFNVKAYSADNL